MKRKIIRYEQHFDDGSKQFLDKENSENFTSNLGVANGVCSVRGYIEFKPVVWESIPAPTEDKKAPDPQEIIKELWSLWESMAECGELKIGPQFSAQYKSLKEKLSKLKK